MRITVVIRCQRSCPLYACCIPHISLRSWGFCREARARARIGRNSARGVSRGFAARFRGVAACFRGFAASSRAFPNKTASYAGYPHINLASLAITVAAEPESAKMADCRFEMLNEVAIE